jgi:hypothetical protein
MAKQLRKTIDQTHIETLKLLINLELDLLDSWRPPRIVWLAKFSIGLREVNGDLTKLGKRQKSYPRGASKWVIENGKLMRYMKCVRCDQWKERTTDHFKAAVVGKDVKLWFNEPNPGFEALHNSPSHPCRECYKEVDWIRSISAPYRLLRPSPDSGYQDSPAGWFKEKWDNFVMCPITGLPKSYFELGPKRFNGISINSTVLDREEGLGYSQENHKSETTELCAKFANVRQDEKIVKLDWRPFYVNFIKLIQEGESFSQKSAFAQNEEYSMVEIGTKKWKNSPSENGVVAKCRENKNFYSKQVRDLHLPNVVGHAVSGHIFQDTNIRRNNPHTAEELKQIYYDLLIEQGFRCATSKMMMTIENGPQRFSFDRIDDSLGHVKGNIQVVCRIFNPGNGDYMDFKRFLHIFLNQIAVEVPKDVRTKAEEWYNHLEASEQV